MALNGGRCTLTGLALRLAPILLAIAALPVHAQQSSVVDLATRPDVTQRMLFVAPDTKPKAAAVLIAGGHGALKIYPNGSFGWGEQGLLVRSRGLLAQQGIAVLVIDSPSDRRSGLAGFRDSEEHAVDVGASIKWLRERTGLPVWLIGHSRGTESAVSAALRLGAGPAGPDGLVLAAPISSDSAFVKGKALTQFPLESLHLPVLVLSHREDACSVTVPKDLPLVTDRLTGATRKAVVLLDGGTPVGDLCGHQATHGLGGLDQPAVKAIAQFMLQDSP